MTSGQVEYLNYLYPSELVREIATQTNLYARQALDAEKCVKLSKVTTEHIQAFLGFNFLMGQNPKPSLNDYWKKDHLSLPTYCQLDKQGQINREISRYLGHITQIILWLQERELG